MVWTAWMFGYACTCGEQSGTTGARTRNVHYYYKIPKLHLALEVHWHSFLLFWQS